MIHLFVPYYGGWPSSFQECLDRQTVKFRLFKYDTKEADCGHASAVNLFHREFKRYRGTADDVICIMCNDITFDDNFLSEGYSVEPGAVLIPRGTGISFDWRTMRTSHGADTFSGRAFFMRAPDFIKSGGFSRLIPHYLSDYDYGFRMVREGMRIDEMIQGIKHDSHAVNTNAWSVRSVNNPVSWTVFLLRWCCNRHIFLNILKSWYRLFK